jgi:hypothetical protein
MITDPEEAADWGGDTSLAVEVKAGCWEDETWMTAAAEFQW